ncbi:hypothetical protein GF359_01570 [candidate division WOR-3 bacterium]|uniref:FlgD/Vpr Ig-like domain-containing protein n=1 Tax=candidate division WOR-3 bacterium TaxID=2052148 RepID=A0A9D5QCC3_UNCW3|nr:hypothetical protein [candidate division WOR-3 bacterium]MBD3363882.1 hypothetical protein [candidate division WOR-3 bacterium]
MKKAFLLSLLLVVAASAAMTVTLSPVPTKVGESFTLQLAGGEANDKVQIYVNSGGENKRWIDPIETDLNNDGAASVDAEITHPGSNLTVYVTGADNGESDPFNIALGEPVNWQIIAPGQEKVEGNATVPSGKTGTGAVTAGDTITYDINVCDVWYNTIDDNPTGFEISCTQDPFIYYDTTAISLRKAGTSTVRVSGGAYNADESSVTVSPGEAVALLMICPGETHLPGDDSTTLYPGKTGEVNDAIMSQDYLVDIYAVDLCWNIDPSYGTYEVDVEDGATPANNLTPGRDTIENGRADDVNLEFVNVKPQGEIISAKVIGDELTSYGTKVDVAGDIDSLYAFFTTAEVPVGVTSDYTVEAYIGGVPAGSDNDIALEITEAPEGSEATLPDTIETLPNPQGVAYATFTPDVAGTYVIRASAGGVYEDATLEVEDPAGLTIYPNPFKYAPSQDVNDINFKYEVVSDNPAAEVVLMIIDIAGNIVYKATYDETGDEKLEPGYQTIVWDGTNGDGVKIASGMYQAVLKVTIGITSEFYPKKFMVIW